jgi:hypothetical protein
MLKKNLISEKDINIITLATDDIDEAYAAILKGCKDLGFDGKK